jgi:nucleoside-diphosphate-sugar epimerase
MYNILVTGAGGFIGRAVVDRLVSLGVTVIGYDRTVREVPGIARWYHASVCDSATVAEAVEGSDGVIHLAGVLGTAELLDHIGTAVTVNILGTLEVAEACLRYGKPLVHISPGNIAWPSIYPATRRCADTIVEALACDRGLRAAIVRAYNAYGPWQKHAPVRKLIPNLIRSALLGEPATIYGNGEQLIDPIWVNDVAWVLWRALQYLQHGDVPPRTCPLFEAGMGIGITVNEVADRVWWSVQRVSRAPKRYLAMRPGEPLGSCVVANPASLAALNLRPSTDFLPLTDGLARTVAWYLTHPSWLDIQSPTAPDART